MNAARIELDRQEREYRSDEELTGRVIVTVATDADGGPPTRLKKVEVGFQRFERRRMTGFDPSNPNPSAQSRTRSLVGWRTIGVDVPAPVAGESRSYPFRIAAPRGAFSYDGTLIRVRWALTARASWGFGSHVSAAIPVAFLPADGGAELDSRAAGSTEAVAEVMRAHRTRERKGCSGPATDLFWQALALVVGLVATVPVMNTSGYEGPLLLLIPSLAVVVMRALLAHDRVGGQRIAVETSPAAVRPGDPLEVRIGFRPKWPLTHGAVSAEVVAYERVTIDEDLRDRAERFRHEVELAGPGTYLAGEWVEYDFELDVPGDAPPSLAVQDGEVVWAVRLDLPVPRWIDKWLEHEFVVLPLPGRAVGTVG